MIYLMYHDVVTKNDSSSGFQNQSAFQYKISEETFENHVRLLKDSEVCFSFDDGGDSFITRIAPILEKYGKTGLFFISTKYIDTPGFLTSDQIRDLSNRGHIIGSHSHSHPQNISILPKCDIFNEWKTSISILSSILGKPVSIASIPNGYESRNVILCAKEVGITDLYTSRPVTHITVKDDVRLFGRYVIHSKTPNDLLFNLQQSKYLRFKLHLKWILLEIVKSVLGNFYNKFKTIITK